MSCSRFKEFRNLSSNPCFTGRKVSLYLRTLDSIVGGLPLTNISIIFIEASECDQLSTQVRKTNILATNEWTLLLYGWLLSCPVVWWNGRKNALSERRKGLKSGWFNARMYKDRGVYWQTRYLALYVLTGLNVQEFFWFNLLKLLYRTSFSYAIYPGFIIIFVKEYYY